MKGKAIVLALLAFAFQAQAATISQSQAVLAARAWMNRGGTLGERLGTGVRSVGEHQTSGGYKVFAMQTTGGGTVFLSSDTDDTPIIAFSSQALDLAQIDRRSPLWKVLDRSGQRVMTSATSGRNTDGAAAATNAGLWAALIKEGQTLAQQAGRHLLMAAPQAYDPGDLRVAPLLKAMDSDGQVRRILWSQSTTVDGAACWNYYTPNGIDPAGFVEGDSDNVVCGCVATATAQVMRYFRYPTAEVEPQTRQCAWADKPMDLTMQGGTYDWDLMTPDPNGSSDFSTENRQAIGKLVSDVGIAVYMDYNQGGLGESGAYSFDVSGALTGVFGYGNATFFQSGDQGILDGALGKEKRAAALGKILFANFDAGLPVVLGLSGHEIAADGYGYNSGTDYIHLNFGWASEWYDIWYNVPNIDRAGFYGIKDVIYNIFPEAGSDNAVLSGRVIDDDRKPLAGAKVKVFPLGSEEAVAELETSASGVWAAILPKGAYSVELEWTDGAKILMADIDKVSLNLPKTKDVKWNGLRTVPTVSGEDPESFGNSWGNDAVLYDPTVRIVRGDATNLFSRLDKALAASVDGDVIEILAPTTLKTDVLAEKSIVILATNENARASAVTRVGGAAVTVAEGATVVFTNVAFVAETPSTAVRVRDGGKIEVSGVAVFDDLYSFVPGIVTETASGFRLTGELLNGLTLDCKAAQADGMAFGVYALSCEFAAASRSAARIASSVREDRLGLALEPDAESGRRLVWKDGSTATPEVAVAQVTSGDRPGYYRTLNTLFAENASTDLDLTLLLTKAVQDVSVAASGRRIRMDSLAEGGTVVTVDKRYAGFAVSAGGSLAVQGAIFEGALDTTFLFINAGEVTFAAGAGVRNLVCNYSWPSGGVYGAVAVKEGRLTLMDGAVISGCRAENATQANYGGGVYLGAKGELNLIGGSIRNCYAAKFGGGVYACPGANVRVSGAATVWDNGSANNAKDDLFLATSACGLTVDDSLSGGVIGIRYGGASATGNGEGEVFARLASSGLSVEKTAFVNDLTNDLTPKVSGLDILWFAEPVGPQPLNPAEAAKRAVAATVLGSMTNYYASVEDAFGSLEGAAEVLVLTNAAFSANVSVPADVTLKSSDVIHEMADGRWTLMRGADCSLMIGTGVTLSVTNLVLDGGAAGIDPTANALLDVNGSSAGLHLLADAKVCNVRGGHNRGSCAIKIWNGADVTMESGSEITDCWNMYVNAGENNGCGGGLLVDDRSTAHLRGGVINWCGAYSAGGVFVGNGSTVYVSGDLKIKDNVTLNDEDSNLGIADGSTLVLDGLLTGLVGVSAGYAPSETNIFGSVASSVSRADAATSANNFIRDANGDLGLLVQKGVDDRLLVWSNAVDADGAFGEYEIAPETKVPVEVPAVDNGLVRDDLEYTGVSQQGVLLSPGYLLTDAEATEAGDHESTAVLKKGFVWTDETTDDKIITWTISKAEYDLSKVVFNGASFVYDGQGHALAIKGDLPFGVTVEYDNNCQTNVALDVEGHVVPYLVTARFTGDEKNYESIPDMTAELLIRRATYDLDAFSFNDVDYAETGSELSIFVTKRTDDNVSVACPEGTEVLPGLVVSYEGNGQSEPGVYSVTATFTGDSINYEKVDDLTATMTIVKSERKGEEPGPQPQPVDPYPITFTSIEQVEGNWVIVADQARQGCDYALYGGTTLNTNEFTEVVIRTKWLEPDGPLTNTVPVDSSQPCMFWQIRAWPGSVPSIDE